MSTTINGLRSNVSRDELIDETIALVQGHKIKDGLVWDQTEWVKRVDCGTACCVAGGAAIAAGYVPHEIDFNRWKWRRPRGKTIYEITSLGRRLLRLDGFEAEWLFHHERTKRQVLAGLRKLKDGGRINELGAFRTYIKEMYDEPSWTNWDGATVSGRDGWEYYQKQVKA